MVECRTSRRKKGIGIFKLASASTNKEWRSHWLNEIDKHRIKIKIQKKIPVFRFVIDTFHINIGEVYSRGKNDYYYNLSQK